jgi:hypothetical protein
VAVASRLRMTVPTGCDSLMNLREKFPIRSQNFPEQI